MDEIEDYEFVACYDGDKVRQFSSLKMAESFMNEMAELGHDVEVYAYEVKPCGKCFLVGKRSGNHD